MFKHKNNNNNKTMFVTLLLTCIAQKVCLGLMFLLIV